MSELKAVHAFDVYEAYTKTGDDDAAQVYIKSEADKVIAEKDSEIARLNAIRKVHVEAIESMEAGLLQDDKEIRHQKYKRCLLRSVIAEMNATHFKDLFYGEGSEALADEYNKQITIHYKWHNRWLELAEKFKTNSTAQQGKEEVK